mmetsp:Transcript_30904/g.69811  ORF Transcript_30904/g.69811 Transcript_30904/m.69811 type:complete len:207 (-) Transcript_30904:131-751(-)
MARSSKMRRWATFSSFRVTSAMRWPDSWWIMSCAPRTRSRSTAMAESSRRLTSNPPSLSRAPACPSLGLSGSQGMARGGGSSVRAALGVVCATMTRCAIAAVVLIAAHGHLRWARCSGAAMGRLCALRAGQREAMGALRGVIGHLLSACCLSRPQLLSPFSALGTLHSLEPWGHWLLLRSASALVCRSSCYVNKWLETFTPHFSRV